MAGNAFVKIRLWNPGLENIYGDTSNILKGLQKDIVGIGSKRYFEIFYVGATQADEELGTAANSVKDGTTTPFQITVVSASANDTDASAGHARKVALIGITVGSGGVYYKLGSTSPHYEHPRLTVEVVNLNGATDVLATRYYLRLIHAYVCDWGSGGGDAAGDITIESPADTDLQTIKQNYNESNGCVLFFEPDMQALWDFIAISPTATLAAGDGIVVQADEYGFDKTTNIDPDYPTDSFSYVAGRDALAGIVQRPCWLVPKLTTVQSKLTFTHQLVANSQTLKVHLGVLVTQGSKS